MVPQTTRHEVMAVAAAAEKWVRAAPDGYLWDARCDLDLEEGHFLLDVSYRQTVVVTMTLELEKGRWTGELQTEDVHHQAWSLGILSQISEVVPALADAVEELFFTPPETEDAT